MKWYARGGGIRKQGPFDSQIEAVNSIRQVPESDRDYQYALCNGASRPKRYEFPPDAFVWPEEN